MKKILLITNIPTPYRIPLFNELHQRLQQSSIHLKIIFSVQNYARRKWQLDEQDFLFPYDFLNKTKLVNSRENTRFRYPGLLQKLLEERPELIIVSGFSAATMVSLIYSRITGIPYVIWSGEIAVRGDRVSWLRSVQRKWLTRAATHFIAYGSQASNYLQQLGASPTHISIAINTVDTTFSWKKWDKYKEKLNPQ